MKHYGNSKDNVKASGDGSLVPHEEARIGVGEKTISVSVFSLRKSDVGSDMTHVLRIALAKDTFRLFVSDPKQIREFTDYLHKFAVDGSKTAERYVEEVTGGHVKPSNARRKAKP